MRASRAAKAHIGRKFEAGTVSDRAEIVLHVSMGRRSVFHAELWADVLVQGGHTFVIVARSIGLFSALRRRRPDLPVTLATGASEINLLLARLPRARIALYTSNSGDVIHLLRNEHLTHVFIGHGDSEKRASVSRYFRLYDEIWVAGQAQIDRLEASGNTVPQQVVRIVGRPHLQALLEIPPAGDPSQGPSYLPTWEGPLDSQNYSSLPLASRILSDLLDRGVQPITAKLHPWTGRRERSFRSLDRHLTRTARSDDRLTVIPKSSPIDQLMSSSLFVLSDISSVAVDAMALGRPIIVFEPTTASDKAAPGALPFSRYAYTYRLPEEVGEIGLQLAHGIDPLRESRDICSNYFVDRDATRGGRFHAFLQSP